MTHPNSKSVIIDGVEYPSYSAAARATNLDRAALHRVVEECDGSTAKYYDHIYSNRRQGVKCSCTINGVTYHSMTDAARDLGVSSTMIRKRMTKSHGQAFDYQKTQTAPVQKRRGGGRSIPCTIDGVWYKSYGAAAAALGLSRHHLRELLAHQYDDPDVCREPRSTIEARLFEDLPPRIPVEALNDSTIEAELWGWND